MSTTTDNPIVPEVITKTFTKKTLINTSELVKFLNLGDTFQACNFGDLKAIEQNEFNQCFGAALYDHMIMCLAKYEDQKEWNDEDTYPVGCVVSHCGLLYIVKKESQCIPPPDIEHYDPAPKFDHNKKCGAIYEFLYCNYLGPYLANCIAVRQLPHLHASLTSIGVTVQKGENYQPASKEIYNQKRMAYENSMHMYFNLIKKFIEECKDSGCFDGSKFIDSGTCCNCGCVEETCGCGDNCEEDIENLNDYGVYDPTQV